MMKIASLVAMTLAAFGPPAKAETFEEYRCWDTTKVAVYMNDAGTQRRFERVEYNSPYCGGFKPTLDLVVDNDWGDRFKPVRVDVQYFNIKGERSNNWEFEVDEGRAEKVGHELHIYGDGTASEYTQYLRIYTPANLTADAGYMLNEEPRCARTGNLDCMGYEYRGPPAGYIYYGEEDKQVVEWEFAAVIYRNQDDELITDTNARLWEYAQRRVDWYNMVYERNDIYVRYKLVDVATGRFQYPQSVTKTFRNLDINADVGLGMGATCPNTCGCAFANTYFIENSGQSMVSLSACGPVVDLHEIGHSIGLAHGPENRSNEAYGYIWPEFGHGWSTPFCGIVKDIMSYGGARDAHHNSKQTCDELYNPFGRKHYNGEGDDPAGDRVFADAAYHINRVRYDVSLIAREGEGVEAYQTEEPAEPAGDLIMDEATVMDPTGELRAAEQRGLRSAFGSQIER